MFEIGFNAHPPTRGGLGVWQSSFGPLGPRRKDTGTQSLSRHWWAFGGEWEGCTVRHARMALALAALPLNLPHVISAEVEIAPL